MITSFEERNNFQSCRNRKRCTSNANIGKRHGSRKWEEENPSRQTPPSEGKQRQENPIPPTQCPTPYSPSAGRLLGRLVLLAFLKQWTAHQLMIPPNEVEKGWLKLCSHWKAGVWRCSAVWHTHLSKGLYEIEGSHNALRCF